MEQRSEQNVCILVVDDEQDIRRIIRILLESSGYQVAEAPNGLAAVEYIRQQPNVDLVLMDIMMPGLNGIEASRAIRERCSAPNFVPDGKDAGARQAGGVSGGRRRLSGQAVFPRGADDEGGITAAALPCL